ncbi:MAG: hotdog domain-containing protein [Planctomycetaceae bacterium]
MQASDFNSLLGLRPGPDAQSVELLARAPDHVIGGSFVHMAVLTTLGEVAAARAAGGDVIPASLHAVFLKPAPLGLLRARGRLLTRGRRLCTAEGEVFSGETLVAKVTVSFAVTAV